MSSAAPTKKWTAADLPDLSGRTFLVTGANSGIGRVAAREFAGAGAHVIIAVRNLDKGLAAAADMPSAVEVRVLDLADLGSVRAFAGGWQGDLDVLVNNAGVMGVPLTRTGDGFELHMATNHLGPFALTNLLLPSIRDRVVTVSSGMHRAGRIRFDDLNWQKGRYERWLAYGQTKLANLLFTSELQRRLIEAGSPVRAVAAHPGWAATNLQSHTGSAVQNTLLGVANRVWAQSDEMGALPTLYAATQDVPPNAYVGPDGFQEQRGHPTLVGRSAAARNPDTARRLWELSERLTGVSFPLSPAGD